MVLPLGCWRWRWCRRWAAVAGADKGCAGLLLQGLLRRQAGAREQQGRARRPACRSPHALAARAPVTAPVLGRLSAPPTPPPQDAVLVVPLHSYPSLNKASFPARLDFGRCALGERVTRRLALSCSVPAEFSFK
jgi:hypothetical protein